MYYSIFKNNVSLMSSKPDRLLLFALTAAADRQKVTKKVKAVDKFG